MTPALFKAYGRLIGLKRGKGSEAKWQRPSHQGGIVKVGIGDADGGRPFDKGPPNGPDLDEDRCVWNVDSGCFLPRFRCADHERLQQEIAVDERYYVPFELAAGWRYWLIRKVVRSRVLARLWSRRAKPDSRAWWRRFV